MDQASPSNLSIAKVKVEYHDPSGIFSLIADQFDTRLPLHNLNWKSPTRPLRSIESLHVDLVSGSSGTVANADRASYGNASGGVPVKERRHQIPGLRQTPYLKLYLLRCDDAESYKATYRKAIRDWLKSHTPPSQSSSKKANSQENHDAFEWMIFHVVLPGTRAAHEKTASPGPGGRPESAGSDRSKVLNKGANTLLEKLKADFNGSNKAAPDRIAQLKLSGLGSELTQDQREEWDDTIAKIKALILASFDQRVRQYENDIMEKDAQRSLPGWNFCTFFVLKEGLARGFESVGLIDDALAGYEELSAELESLQALEDNDGPAASLLPFTKDLQDLFTRMQDNSISSDQNFWGPDNPPISTAKKNYREMILANNISIFEFKCYILARKMAILLRMSRATKAGAEDLVPLGHLCQLAVLSIPNISRIMQADLRVIAADDHADTSDSIIDNIVASWVFTATQQVLADTSSAFLAVSSPNEPHFSSLLKGNQSAYPTRKSSLNAPAQRKPRDDAQALFDQLKSRSESSPTTAQNRSGKDYLALQRAQLLLLQRRQVEAIAGRVQFVIGWTKSEQPGVFAAFKDVDLDAEDSENEDTSSSSTPQGSNASTVGICNFALYDASTSRKAIRSAYESLTREALDLFFTAGQSRSFERMLADLAMVRYQSGDYAGAANHFAKIIPVYAQTHWTLIETEMLLVHAKCLKILNRRDDYVRMLLGLLSLIVISKTSNRLTENSQHYDLESYTIHGQTILDELNIIASQLPYDITVNLSTYFQNMQLEPHIHHNRNVSGFQMRLKLRSVFEGHIVLSKVTVLLASLVGDSVSDILLNSDGDIRLTKGCTTISLTTNTITNGRFVLKSVVMQSGHILFTHDVTASGSADPSSRDRTQAPRILVYPRVGDLVATLSMSRIVHIDQPRRLELDITNGTEAYEDLVITLKPASSGFRVHTSEATIIDSGPSAVITPSATQISMSALQAHGSISIALPYELDDAHSQIFLGVEIRSNDSALDYRSVQSAVIELPLDVNVHDLFKEDHMFQRFHLKSSNDLPLEVLDINLQETDDFKIEAPTLDLFPTIIFPKHPATYMYSIKQVPMDNSQITRRLSTDREAPLVLTVVYRCYDDLIIDAIARDLSDALEEKEFLSAKALLIGLLKDRLRQTLTTSQVTAAALTKNIHCPTFESIGWGPLIRDLPSQEGMKLKSFLEQWHAHNQVVSLPEYDATNDRNQASHMSLRKLVVAVPLPHLDILQVAKLAIPEFASGFAAVGIPFCATLTLRHVTRWATPQHSSDETLLRDFMYDVDAPIDTWLIGGQRRGRFTAKPQEVLSWQIILIPLRTGKLLLPSVDVRVIGKDADGITCETEYKGSGHTLTVIDDLKRTTVAIFGNESKLVLAES